MITGVLLFSKLIHFFMNTFEMPTCFCFLGLILGTLPMVWKEVKREGFAKKYYAVILLSATVCFWFFRANPNAFAQVDDPTLLQSVLLGVAVAATAIIPGVDPAVFLSALGLYSAYVAALAQVDLAVLIPLALGLAVGAVVISFCMNFFFRRFYTITYSVIFGIFLSMIPNMLSENCVLGFNWASAISVVLLILGFFVSYFLGKREKANT